MTATTPPSSPLPTFHILCNKEEYITAFESARKKYSLHSSINITYHHTTLSSLPPETHFDAIVSPANSYARMDGGFDDALSRAFSPPNDYMALSRVAQEAVYKSHRGFLAPGNCLLVSLEDERLVSKWGCKWLALCPTMKVPQRVEWDREVVYECVWGLLNAIDQRNRCLGGGLEGRIHNVLMTPLATGYGGWSAERWAAQTVLAMKHFVEVVEGEKGWVVRGPVRIMGHVGEVEGTWAL